MTDFAQYDGYKHDFDFHIGPARAEEFHSKAFGDRLWADLSRILEKPFEGATIEPDAPDGHRYRFEDDLSAHLHSAPRSRTPGCWTRCPPCSP
ncbi:hypothetical protein K6168_23955 [Streptomyces sp. FB2]|uniref:hypothetical protein n=1 Tax=Streptomyces sp. FB2 TaxID=2902454 RepID=UPI001F185952|nr:hypothetical protein [Streptomyces sp. FB2]MCF2538691.1 hypothetical protein [Streptomyces sp. FB2]